MTAIPQTIDVDALRQYLQANNGLKDLQLWSANELQRIVASFRKDGFVVVSNVLNQEQIEILEAGCKQVVDEVVALDDGLKGNRGSRRYSFGGSSMTRSQLHRPAWQMLLELDVVHDIVGAIFGSSDYVLRAASGDFCLPGALEYQRLHADVRDWISPKETPFSSFYDPVGMTSIRDLPCPYVCVNFLPQDVTKLNGPTRQIPGTQNARAQIPGLDTEPEWMRLSTVCPVPAGSIMVRDTRAWHGGTPNVSDQVRAIPNLEFYAPWFREPMKPAITYADFKGLSERARRLVAHSVLDSSETLDTRTTLRAP